MHKGVKIKKIQLKTLAIFFNFTTRAISTWKKEKRPVILFLLKYFSNEDISQFLEKGKVDRLEYLKDCDSVCSFIHNEVFQSCKNVSDQETFKIFGEFLKSIESIRMEKTWIDFENFQKREKEIANFIETEFAKFLIDKKINDLVFHQKTIQDYYLSMPMSHKYYFIKHYMWIFMPTDFDNTLSQINKVYNNLPSYIQSIPGIKFIIQAAGFSGFIGYLEKKD